MVKVKKATQYLKFVSTLLRAKLIRRRIPLIAVLCVTNRCNLSCWYCYGEHPLRGDYLEFSTEELLYIVRTLGRLGTQVLQLQGGEPLLRDDLLAIIAEAQRFGMVCDMVTNGILVECKVELISRLSKICISLDGPPEINDRNRGRGTHAQIVRGIQCARSCGVPVRISTVLTQGTTTADIDWLVDFAKKHRLILNFSPSFEFLARFHPEKSKPHRISADHLRSLFQHIINYKKNKAPIQFSLMSYTMASQWPFDYEKRRVFSYELPARFRYPRCYHGDYIVFIDSDGSLYPCCNFWGRSQWNVRTQGLEESINGLSRQNCEACYIPAYIDRNLFFNSWPGVWKNYIIQNMKEVL